MDRKRFKEGRDRERLRSNWLDRERFEERRVG